MKSAGKGAAGQFAVSALQQYHRQLRAFMRRRTALAQDKDMDDLLQEVWLRLLKANHPELIRDPLNYVLTVGAHLIEEIGRRDRRCAEIVAVNSELAEEACERPAAWPRDPLAKTVSLQNQVTSALRKLPPLYQAVVLLFYREGQSYEEIAVTLNISVHKVERYLAEAKEEILRLDWKWE